MPTQFRSLPRIRAFLALAGVLLLAGCYHGGEREKEPPVGYPGGFCLAPNASCYEGACDVQGGAYCYDPADPCKGIFCGGHGSCLPNAEAKPTCLCDAGFSNETFGLFCELGGQATAPSTEDGADTTAPDMGG